MRWHLMHVPNQKHKILFIWDSHPLFSVVLFCFLSLNWKSIYSIKCWYENVSSQTVHPPPIYFRWEIKEKCSWQGCDQSCWLPLMDFSETQKRRRERAMRWWLQTISKSPSTNSNELRQSGIHLIYLKLNMKNSRTVISVQSKPRLIVALPTLHSLCLNETASGWTIHILASIVGANLINFPDLTVCLHVFRVFTDSTALINFLIPQLGLISGCDGLFKTLATFQIFPTCFKKF